jgi:hypothetical protein
MPGRATGHGSLPPHPAPQLSRVRPVCHQARPSTPPRTPGLTHAREVTMPRWLILLIAALVILAIAVLWAGHVHVSVR